MKYSLFLLLFFCFSTACNKTPQEPIVVIQTNFGNIKVKLYNETPMHQKNFLALVNEEFYNNLTFHRVIKDFIIQGGPMLDMNSDSILATNKMQDTISAEIKFPMYFHKKGALAAARWGANENPTKASDKFQFYIVTGEIYSDYELSEIEKKSNISYSPQQRKTYKTIGGTPYLDNEYTVFGEVIEGLDIVCKIQETATNETGRPINDIIIKKVILKN